MISVRLETVELTGIVEKCITLLPQTKSESANRNYFLAWKDKYKTCH